MKPKVSVITISYNSSQLIENTIKSVTSQTYRNVEYIVVDGLSDDGTRDILKANRSKIHTLICEKDTGISDAFNKGIRASTGDLIIFMNCGDVFASDEIIEEIAHSYARLKWRWAIGRHRIVSNEGVVIHTSQEIAVFSRRDYMVLNKFCHQAMAMERTVFEDFGLFNESYRIAMDFELILRISTKISPYMLDLMICDYLDGGLSAQSRKKTREEEVKAKREVAGYNSFDIALDEIELVIMHKLLPRVMRVAHNALKASYPTNRSS
ncbi:glycosyltransferase family 2 protein [Deinococcus pimensis]|uniref:glycosyltransferase family 2 protein n=1 Tax=Deinococcus pimensis TaxID=309888 RepID=UPI00146FBBC9|nr:glycosyltransferase family 2 protein [Deinococcus pimensis]